MLSPKEAYDLSVVKHKVTTLAGLLEKYKYDELVREKDTERRLRALEAGVRSNKDELNQTKQTSVVFDEYISKIEVDLEYLHSELSTLIETVTSVEERTIKDTPLSQDLKVEVEKLQEEGLPVLSPAVTGRVLIDYLRGCSRDGLDGITYMNGLLYVDLATKSIEEGLPYNMSPAKARSLLRTLRLTRRVDRATMNNIGWRKLPKFGVVLELTMSG